MLNPPSLHIICTVLNSSHSQFNYSQQILTNHHLFTTHYLTFIHFWNVGPGPALGEFGGEGAEGIKTKKQKATDENGDLLGEEVKPRSKLPPLLTPLGDLKSEKLHWLGVSFGLTSQLLNFWSRKLFKVLL